MSIRSLYKVLTAKEAPTNTNTNSQYPYRRSNSIIPSKIRNSSIGFRELEDDEDEEEEHFVPRHLRSRKYKDHVSILIMHDHHDIPGKSEETPLKKGTGFPEPLCGDRNTTLPHPDADTSLDATIEAKDIPPLRVQSRHRLFHGRHQSKTRSKNGTISVEPIGSYDNIQYADGSVENVSLIEKERASKASKHDSVIDVGARISGESLCEGKEGTGSDSDGKSEDGERKKGRMLRKLHLY